MTRLGDTHRAAGDEPAAHHAWRQALPILDDLHHPDAKVLRARLREPMGYRRGTSRVPGADTLGIKDSERTTMPTKLASLLRSRKAAALLLGLLTVVALGAGAGTASASEGARVEILNANSDLCMSIPGDVIYTGQRIDQWDCGGYADQYWYLNPSASHPGWFYIQPQQNDTLCATYVPRTNDILTLQGCGTNAGSGNASTQLWRYIGDNELETFQGWAMSVPGASTTHDVSINIYPYGPYLDQHWGIYSA